MLALRAGLATTLATGGALALLAAPAPALVPACAGAGPNHAAVVVEHGDGRIVTRCVAFSSATIDGATLLRLSGIAYRTVSYPGLGDAVCQVDGEPATFPPSCWSSTSPYWVVSVARGGKWTTSPLGIDALTFRDGEAEGLRYQPQTAAPAPPDGPARCPASEATATPATPASTATPRPPATATPARTSAPAHASPTTAGVASAPPTSPPPIEQTPPASPAGTGATSAVGLVGVSSSDGPTSDPLASAGGGAARTTDSTPATAATWAVAALAVVLLGGIGLGAVRRRSRGTRP